MKLVRYSCGCVGFEPNHIPNKGNATIVFSCRNEDGKPYTLGTENMAGKTYEEIDPQRAKEIQDILAALIADGYRLRDVRSALS